MLNHCMPVISHRTMSHPPLKMRKPLVLSTASNIKHTTTASGSLCVSNGRLSVATLRWWRPLPIRSPGMTSITMTSARKWWWLAGPSSLVHGRHDRLRPPRPTWPPAPPHNAAEDGNQKETSNSSTDADDEVLVVRDPAADFLGGGGPFAGTL